MPSSLLHRSCAALALPALLLPVLACAQATPNTLTAARRTVVINEAAEVLTDVYVEADTGRLIGEVLLRRLAEGAYDRLDNPAQFADAVSRDMRSLNNDLHLGLQYSPPGTAVAAGGGQANPRARNFGLAKVEILDGNVGYLEITGFMGAEGYRDAVVDALRLLSRTDAMIIDVRRNGGGSGEMSHFIFSHFLGPEPVPTIRIKQRNGEPRVRQSFGEVPGPRRPDVPLLVLTSEGTGSAAEEFSFVLRHLGRATIVGTRTAGAGHMVTDVPLSDGFTARVSVTRVMAPDTHAEWEGVGVQPHIAVEAAAALDAAHEEALNRIRAASGPTSALDRVLEVVRARRSGVQANADELAGLAGEYEGRVISQSGGQLWYARRRGALAEPLVPLGNGRFGLGGTRYIFSGRDGSARLTIEQSNGNTVQFQRSPLPDPSPSTNPGLSSPSPS